MPYKNKHSARIKEPGDFEKDSFRRKNIETGIDIIIGRLKGKTTTTTQAYRFKKDKYTPAQAKKWLKNHDVKYISFEPAEEEKQMKEKKQDKKIERRVLNIPVKVVRSEDGSIGSIYGYPIVYNKDSEYMGFIERIAPGAATKALKNSDIRGLKNHEASLIFAREGINLTITEDKEGVRYEATPVDTLNFREIAKEVDLGLLTGQSFGFNIKSDKWVDLDKDIPKRIITELEIIHDVGPVTFPAYPDTNVAIRSLNEARNQTIDEKNISIVVDEIEYIFNSHEEFDRVVEKINELRKNDTSPSTAVLLWKKIKASQKTAANNDKTLEDKTLIRLKTAGRKLSI